MSRRLTILAGAGALVTEVVAGARALGDEVQVLALVPRPDLGTTDIWGLSRFIELVAAIRSFETSHLVMAGAVTLTDADRAAIAKLAGAGADARGDAALSGLAERIFAMTGARLVGVEAIVPELLAGAGHIAGPEAPELMPTAMLALQAARAVGRIDMGQAAIAAGGRVLAAEDVAGTDALIERMALYRARGLAITAPMVLAKAAKPQQPLFVDLPAIGAATIANAARAGIAAIAVEAKRTILVDRPSLIAAAETAGIPVFGLSLDG